MNKKRLYFLTVVWCFVAAVYAVQHWTPTDRKLKQPSNPFVENTTSTCTSPYNLGVKNIKTDEATIYWEDTSGTAWEYIVQLSSDPYPNSTGSGTSATTKEITVTQDHNGNTLLPDTQYEFYVRTDCGTEGTSSWAGPYDFKTLCAPVNLPFTETFESISTTVDCWTIIDVDGDGTGTTTKTNAWGTLSDGVNAYEGANSMQFSGTATASPHDDWLISPSVQMNATDIYQLTYYYRTNTLPFINEFAVKLSTNGTNPSEFTTTLLASDTYLSANYTRKTLYITGISGDVHIGWHVTSSTESYIYLDNIKLEKIGCIGLEGDIVMSNLQTDQATFDWTDTNNTDWEYYVQAAGSGEPTGSGTLASSKSVTVTRTNGTGGANLQPNTEYDFWLRSACGPGKNSGWVGPFTFKTPCNVQTLPFWEGFNYDSTTVDCWKIVDRNNDSSIWTTGYPGIIYEGSHSAYFQGGQFNALFRPHDDWLISPAFTFDPTKYYKLQYHYRTGAPEPESNPTYEYEFEVLLSDSGVGTSDFKTTVVSKEKYPSITDWKAKTAFMTGVSGNVNFAWHVTSSTPYVFVLIDNVFIEEVDCPTPVDVGVKDIKTDEATIYWDDKFNTDWEYLVQQAGDTIIRPLPTTTGTATQNTAVVVHKDQNGDLLEPNTNYEFYVRGKCANGKDSEWIGPFLFRTLCDVFTTPFWEGFNLDSQSFFCWTVVDGNHDRNWTASTSSNSYNYNIWWQNPTNYEGGHAVGFEGTQKDASFRPHDDWLISPTITFESGKFYRLKYHYRTDYYSSALYEYKFEVLLSDAGIDTNKFTTTIVPEKKYPESPDWFDVGFELGIPFEDWEPFTWQEEYLFISGVSGAVNIAWHVTSETPNSNIYIDNVFIEEVQGCPEPLLVTFGAKDEQSNSVTIFWEDDMGATAWEYYIQEEGNGVPTGNGTTTTNKENTVPQDASGKTLEPNTDYEFYVRTDCGNGAYSIWVGPFAFTTLCDVYTTPFWEGFNSDSKTARCWTILDANGDGTTWNWIQSSASQAYEGDRMVFNSSRNITDDWLISPTIALDGGMYMLKYHQQSQGRESEFEVLASVNGTNPTDFTTVLKSNQIYNNVNYAEEVIFFSGVKGDVNIAWHANSTNMVFHYSILDNVTLKKVETCPEPYYITVPGQTTTTVDIVWEQEGGISEWEVLVVDYGEDETATPVQTVTVTGNPKATINGLDEGKAYTIYVRAKCTDGTSNSDWSTSIDIATKVGANDECLGAINIPVNSGTTCEKTVSGTLVGATASGAAPNTIPTCDPLLQNDVWFEFTATSDIHVLEVSYLDVKALPTTDLWPRLYVAVYDQSCTAMVGGNPPIACYMVYIRNQIEEYTALKDLTPGHKYYVRIGHYITPDFDGITEDQPDFVFKLCLTTPHYLEVSPSGDQYTVEELVKDVLVSSDCDLVSNVHYQVGDGSPTTRSVNTLGYFNRNGADFPFEEGIVLSTGEIGYVPGPYGGTTGTNPFWWAGDHDINDAISDAGGGPRTSKRIAQLEFDFIPVKDSIKLEYLFASRDYRLCMYACQNGAMFVAWLTDITTGNKQNIAKIKGTEIPITLNTIWDRKKLGGNCNSYPELFWNAYGNWDNTFTPDYLYAPFNFAGSTVGMSSKPVNVVPGRKYHIKLAVIHFCTDENHASAVFFNTGGFDLGNLDLGEDLLIATNTAICPGESAVIQSGIATSEELYTEIEWYKDGVLIPGANDPGLEVNEAGEYSIDVRFPELECGSSASIVVEVYPAISETVNQPEMIEVCRYVLQEVVVNLASVETAMFAAVDRSIYTTGYYQTIEEAEAAENEILNVENYTLGKEPQAQQTLYIRVENTVTGCYEVFTLSIQSEEGAVPEQLDNVSVCAEYGFPATTANQYYYTQPGGMGKAYKAGDVLAEPGEHTIYLLQVNSEEGCYEETAYQVNITAPVTADVFEDKTLSCEYYELPPLSEYNHYYTEPEGQGTELYEGMQIIHKQTVYVYASSEDGLCTDESSFTIDYEDCPIPRGISPNNDGLNDVFDLTPHGVESIKIYNRWGTEVYSHGEGYTTQWHGQNKSGKQLPDGTYYYVIHAHGKIRTGWVQINK